MHITFPQIIIKHKCKITETLENCLNGGLVSRSGLTNWTFDDQKQFYYLIIGLVCQSNPTVMCICYPFSGRTKQLLEDVAAEIQARGGSCVPVQVDHSNDAEVEAFFKRVEKDENGKLDVLVNNAYAAVNTIFANLGKPFWTLDPIDQWDTVNGVGLRNHYLCTVYASR